MKFGVLIALVGLSAAVETAEVNKKMIDIPEGELEFIELEEEHLGEEVVLNEEGEEDQAAMDLRRSYRSSSSSRSSYTPSRTTTRSTTYRRTYTPTRSTYRSTYVPTKSYTYNPNRYRSGYYYSPTYGRTYRRSTTAYTPTRTHSYTGQFNPRYRGTYYLAYDPYNFYHQPLAHPGMTGYYNPTYRAMYYRTYNPFGSYARYYTYRPSIRTYSSYNPAGGYYNPTYQRYTRNYSLKEEEADNDVLELIQIEKGEAEFGDQISEGEKSYLPMQVAGVSMLCLAALTYFNYKKKAVEDHDDQYFSHLLETEAK